MLYEKDIERFARENKPDFESRLHDYLGLYPGLEEVTTDLTKDEMEARAKEIVSEGPDPQGLSGEDKTRALEDVADRHPDAAIVPSGQAVMRIEHPDLPHEEFEMNVFPEFGDGSLAFDYNDGVFGLPAEREKDPEDRLPPETRPDQMDVQTIPLEEVPSWAAPEVFDRIMNGRIDLYRSPEAAQDRLDEVPKKTEPILGDETGELRIKTEVEELGRHNGEIDRGLVTAPNGEFENQSQVAAWAVLNEEVGGEPPIPREFDERSSDPSNITETEKSRIRERIRQCLNNPRRFADIGPEQFDEEVFFNQLLRCEFDGYTPPRHSQQEIAGEMREDAFRIIREIARDRGFEVIGDSVRPRGKMRFDPEFPSDLIDYDYEGEEAAEEPLTARS